MRLVCPNCEAKYEVPEDAIPETGRDVQCANCGHAWYQMRPRAPGAEAQPLAPAPVEVKAEPVAEPEAAVPASAEPAPVVDEPAVEAAPETVSEAVTEIGEAVSEAATEVVAEAEAKIAETVETAAADLQAAVAPIAEAIQTEVGAVAETAAEQTPDPVQAVPAEPAAPAEPESPVVGTEEAALAASPDESSDDDDTSARPVAEAVMPAAAYAVDESVLAILREEAEREAKARRVEAKPLEIQPDLGVEAAVPHKQTPTAVPAEVPAADDLDASAKPSARRDLLPDVEEINSTLRPSEDQGDAEAAAAASDAPAEARSSFRSGFLLVMTIAILGAALYMAAPMLRDAVPALAGYLDAYVDFVDGLRLQLDGLMRSATAAIGGEAG